MKATLRWSFALLLAATCVPLWASSSLADNRLSNHGHWDRTSIVAHVKFLDFTSSTWPVGTATADWDQAQGVDPDWVVADASNTCGADCVRMEERTPANDPLFGANCTGYYGYWTNRSPDSNNHWTPDNKVRFNTSCSGHDYPWRRAMVCQELGHALGLDHSASTNSCMYLQPGPADATPSPHDYYMLKAVIYDH